MFTHQDFDRFHDSIQSLSHLELGILTEGLDLQTTSRVDASKVRQMTERLTQVDIQNERRNCLASGTEITKAGFPVLYRIIQYCLNIFGLQSIQFFISDHLRSPIGIGVKNGLVTLPSRCLEILTLAELISVIGHEIGHLACNDCVERAYSVDLINAYQKGCKSGNEEGPGKLATEAERAYKTLQNTEYAADRAGLLCCQDFRASQTALLKVVSNNREIANRIDIDDYIKAHFGSIRLMPWMNRKKNLSTHPFNPLRLLEMKRFFQQKLKPFLDQAVSGSEC